MISSLATIHLLSELGVILLLFVIGLDTDLKKLIQVGGSATAVAIVGVLLPLAGGIAIGQFLGYRMMISVFLGASLTELAAGYVVWKKGLRRRVIRVGMIPRGEVGLIFAQIGLSAKLLSTGLYTAVALMVMLTTFITPPLLRRLLEQGTPQKPDDFTGEYVMEASMDRDT